LPLLLAEADFGRLQLAKHALYASLRLGEVARRSARAVGGKGMRMGYETRSTTVDWISARVWIVLALGLLALFIVITPNSFNALSLP
jgi:hypothetical protein